MTTTKRKPRSAAQRVARRAADAQRARRRRAREEMAAWQRIGRRAAVIARTLKVSTAFAYEALERAARSLPRDRVNTLRDAEIRAIVEKAIEAASEKIRASVLSGRQLIREQAKADEEYQAPAPRPRAINDHHMDGTALKDGLDVDESSKKSDASPATPVASPPPSTRQMTAGMVNGVRLDIKAVAKACRQIHMLVAMDRDFPQRDPVPFDVNEVVRNIELAYRHLEDASMRLGKALQANDGGVSVYDRATTVGA